MVNDATSTGTDHKLFPGSPGNLLFSRIKDRDHEHLWNVFRPYGPTFMLDSVYEAMPSTTGFQAWIMSIW